MTSLLSSLAALLALLARALPPTIAWWVGRKGAEGASAKVEADHAKRAQEIDEDVAGLSDNQLRDELRDARK